ncbi:hypothetical protein CAPTEDRAFT_186132 [Capitella teleta]|uniref:LRRCT domain-containing protein n=1 Tax=Capitella teleta TaxID=283909 RepID=R7VDX1_CAPTE|nr:hypothetical protein CAPTEDRAFT_186132 [Capitella teleta]|eukprot:ELU16824.1 hypothetical protein CAPTEDRAFT_186132 [Capitella teleta]
MATMLFLLLLVLLENSHQETVYIKYRSLTFIPDELVNPEVINLYAGNNDIVELDSIPKLPLLKYLNLDYNNLYAFPNLENVSNTLETLYLKKNNISYIEMERLDKLIHLTSLHLAYNSISSIPDASGPADTLFHLNLESNVFTVFPDWEVFGKSLKYLNLVENDLTEITEDMFRNITELTELLLVNNKLRSDSFSLPGSLKLQVLLLSGNSLTEFPGVGNITTLQNLNLENNQLTNIPAEILSKLTSLQTLNLAGNQMTVDGIPDVAGPNETLTTLVLNNNPINEMPRWSTLAGALTSFSLTQTTVSELTDEDLDYYPVLKNLAISNSNITEFPYLPRNGPRLLTLDLRKNIIERITVAQLQPLQNLNEIICTQNPLMNIPNLCFANFMPYFRLVLRYIPFPCDTKMIWALGAKAAISSYKLDLSGSTCSHPPLLQGIKLQSQDALTKLMKNPFGATFNSREYYPVVPPFNCYFPIASMEATNGSLTCAITCSQANSCLIFGYLPDVGDDLSSPGICAITSTSGIGLETNLHFKWFAPM